MEETVGRLDGSKGRWWVVGGFGWVGRGIGDLGEVVWVWGVEGAARPVEGLSGEDFARLAGWEVRI